LVIIPRKRSMRDYWLDWFASLLLPEWSI